MQDQQQKKNQHTCDRLTCFMFWPGAKLSQQQLAVFCDSIQKIPVCFLWAAINYITLLFITQSKLSPQCRRDHLWKYSLSFWRISSNLATLHNDCHYNRQHLENAQKMPCLWASELIAWHHWFPHWTSLWVHRYPPNNMCIPNTSIQYTQSTYCRSHKFTIHD